MHQAELNRLCQQSGYEGALWRLVRSWDPDKITRWLVNEKARNSGLTPEQAVSCVAEIMAGAALVLASRLSGQRREAILGQRGLCAMMRVSIEHKFDQVGGAHNIMAARPKIILPG